MCVCMCLKVVNLKETGEKKPRVGFDHVIFYSIWKAFKSQLANMLQLLIEDRWLNDIVITICLWY